MSTPFLFVIVLGLLTVFWDTESYTVTPGTSIYITFYNFDRSFIYTVRLKPQVLESLDVNSGGVVGCVVVQVGLCSFTKEFCVTKNKYQKYCRVGRSDGQRQ